MGTAINVGAVLVGTLLGVLLQGRLPLRARETVMNGLGALTIVIGLSMAFQSASLLVVMGAVLLGSIVGEIIGIERWLERLGDRFEARLTRPGATSTFSMGFVTASLLFCIGPMAVVGSIDDALRGDVSVLAMKSVLDGFSSLALSSALGWGVGLAGLSVLVYQGAITAAAGLVEQIMSQAMITELTATGGVLVLAIGVKLLDLKDIRVGNMLPALIFAPLITAAVAAFGWM
ncbi:MAG: DUF554 domain-containing protein [Actinobacteria bacterium]|nr:DUF554 domain-containing protein [Actinomycetota bacterium]